MALRRSRSQSAPPPLPLFLPSRTREPFELLARCTILILFPDGVVPAVIPTPSNPSLPLSPLPPPPSPIPTQEPFELLARRAIGQLLPPALSCKERVHEELVRIAEQACPPEAGRWGGVWVCREGVGGGQGRAGQGRG